MKIIDQIYIGGKFVTPHGKETFDLISPVTNQPIGQVILADEQDTKAAIAAAKEAFKTFSKTTREERIVYLEKLHAAISKRKQDFIAVMVAEYGGPIGFSTIIYNFAVDAISANIEALRTFEFQRKLGISDVELSPIGVVALITPWNASNGFICSKLSTAIAAGCTAVIKPSEMSAMQTQLIMECFHDAGLPAGVINVVTGVGPVVGAELTRHPDVAKISFTGSTAVGKTIARDGAETLKRVTLELGGKSPNIVLDDAHFEEAIPTSVILGFLNSGQACIAATRLLVPENRLEEAKALIKATVPTLKVGAPTEPDTAIGPMVSKKQYERVQSYIRAGIEEGAELLIGGEGHPEGLEAGNFVKPTVFVNVKNDMKIAREEIFGPVLSVLTYQDEEDAINIANDTSYGLAAYIQSADENRAKRVASRIDAGTVNINGFTEDKLAPFGGFKQSGMGREYGIYGLEAYLEPKTITK